MYYYIYKQRAGGNMKRVYVIKSLDDGVIGVATNRKQVVGIILSYTRRYQWETLEDGPWIYRKIDNQLRKKLTAFVTMAIRTRHNQEWENLELEIEEMNINQLNM
jgi:hypothetical protein